MSNAILLLPVPQGIVVVGPGLPVHSSRPERASWHPTCSVMASHLPDQRIEKEVLHLARLLDRQSVSTLHLVTHSLGSFDRASSATCGWCTRDMMAPIGPIVVSVLWEPREDLAYAEMDESQTEVRTRKPRRDVEIEHTTHSQSLTR